MREIDIRHQPHQVKLRDNLMISCYHHSRFNPAAVSLVGHDGARALLLPLQFCEDRLDASLVNDHIAGKAWTYTKKRELSVALSDAFPDP